MTKKDKEIIYKACELVELGEFKFSCHAIWKYDKNLMHKYEKFLGSDWPWESNNAIDSYEDCDVRSTRILALCLFAEVGLGVFDD